LQQPARRIGGNLLHVQSRRSADLPERKSARWLAGTVAGQIRDAQVAEPLAEVLSHLWQRCLQVIADDGTGGVARQSEQVEVVRVCNGVAFLSPPGAGEQSLDLGGVRRVKQCHEARVRRLASPEEEKHIADAVACVRIALDASSDESRQGAKIPVGCL